VRIARNRGAFVHPFVSAICQLDFHGPFEAFVSASQNRVSRRRRPVLVETRFECWVSGAARMSASQLFLIQIKFELDLRGVG
jgi:hypothetical protein